jgi:hypothetical protein
MHLRFEGWVVSNGFEGNEILIRRERVAPGFAGNLGEAVDAVLKAEVAADIFFSVVELR